MNRGRLTLNEYAEPTIKGNVYIYDRDRSVLYFTTNNIKDLTDVLKIKKFWLNKHLAEGTIYLERYYFSYDLVPNAKSNLMSIHEFSVQLDKIIKKSS